MDPQTEKRHNVALHAVISVFIAL